MARGAGSRLRRPSDTIAQSRIRDDRVTHTGCVRTHEFWMGCLRTSARSSGDFGLFTRCRLGGVLLTVRDGRWRLTLIAEYQQSPEWKELADAARIQKCCGTCGLSRSLDRPDLHYMLLAFPTSHHAG